MSNSDDTIKRLLNNLNLGANKANLGDFVLELVRRVEEVEAGGGGGGSGLTPEQKRKLDSIESGATMNRSDEYNADKEHGHSIDEIDELKGIIEKLQVSGEENNRLVSKPDGLYVANDLSPDPLAYYILAKG